MAVSLPNFEQFEVSADPNIGTRWKKWLSKFENLLVAMDIKDNARKRALMLHYAGDDVGDIFDTLSDTGDANEYTKGRDALSKYFQPKVNTEFETYKFRQEIQAPGESMDTYYTRLKLLSANCQFTDNDKEIKSQIIQSCTSSRLRRKALKDNPSLGELLDLARALEISDKQAKDIEKRDSAVNAVHRKPVGKPTTSFKVSQHKSTIRQTRKEQQCFRCGGKWPHRDVCPAIGNKCDYCKLMNHYSKVCRKKTRYSHVREVNCENYDDDKCSETSSDGEYTFAVQNPRKEHKTPTTYVKIGNHSVEMMIDSGASVNIINENIYNELMPRPTLKSTKGEKLLPYSSKDAIPLLGKLECSIESKNKFTVATLYVVKGEGRAILGYETATDLGILHVSNKVEHVSSVETICKDFPDLFKGIGKLKNMKIKLHIDSSVTPVTQPHRRIPFHVRKQVEEELKRLEELDIIEKIDGPTPWVSPIVVAPKPKDPDKIRICVDMRAANKAILRERHIMPTIDDLLNDLNGATVFSKIDLAKGYHQLELEHDSRHITTFSTHIGLRRYKRLNFGISSASEIFQNAIEQTLDGLHGAKNISDDILVWGSGQEDHDRNLRAVLTRLSENNLTLNKAKCEFNLTKIDFYGYVLSKDGLSCDPQKVKAIHDASPPKDVHETKSLLGMASYCSRFIPNFATITGPLRQLTKKDAKWEWGNSQEQALCQLKRSLTGDTVMSYYDPTKITEVLCDASPIGIAAMLIQRDSAESPGHVIAYASRALSPVEQRYSQTEREALSLVWSVEHFHLYLYGGKFSLVTDHKPLVGIFNKTTSKPSVRLERWALRLQSYIFDVIYRPGSTNPADYMSRHPVTCELSSRAMKVAEEYVNYIVTNAVPKSISLCEIQEQTSMDKALTTVMQCINDGKWYKLKRSMPIFYKIRDELTSCNGLVMRGSRIVIPLSLHSCVLQLAHEGHQGIIKTKRLLREKVWFPGVDTAVEKMVKSCLPCQANTHHTKMEPFIMSELPQAPWAEVSIDFCGPFPSGDYLMVVMDEYTRFPEVEILKSVSAKAVLPHLDRIFSTFGVPNQVKTDNGPPFNGENFKKFAEYMGFTHRRITPHWPRANAEVERFMKTLGKTIRAAHMEGKNWRQSMYAFLRNYRATPHCTTDVAPAKVMFGRSFRVKLPEYTPERRQDAALRQQDHAAKSKMKSYADKKCKTQPPLIKEGDIVLVKQKQLHKLSTPFNPEPMKVIAQKGSMITAENGNARITRNSSHFKRLPDNMIKAVPQDTGDFDSNTHEDVNHENAEQNESQNNTSSLQADESGDAILFPNHGAIAPSVSAPDQKRYPTRIRKPPERLKDYVT